MIVKKNDTIQKLEEELRKAKQKEKERVKAFNSKAMEHLIKGIETNEAFKNDFFNLIKRYELKEVLKVLGEVYEISTVQEQNYEQPIEQNQG